MKKRKKTAYIYRLKSEFIKTPAKLIGAYPFFAEFKGEDQHIIAMKFTLPFESLLTQGLVKQIEFLYEKGTSKEREEWEKNGITFTEVLEPDQSTHFSLIMNDDLKKDLTEAELCISLSDEDRGCMFINAPNKIAYYNVSLYEDSGLGELVQSLLKNGYIYRKKVKYGNA